MASPSRGCGLLTPHTRRPVLPTIGAAKLVVLRTNCVRGSRSHPREPRDRVSRSSALGRLRTGGIWRAGSPQRDDREFEPLSECGEHSITPCEGGSSRVATGENPRVTRSPESHVSGDPGPEETTRRTVGDAASASHSLRPFVELLFAHRVGECIQLSAGSMVLGRAQSADLQLVASGVSRLHARVDLQENEAWITDLQSTNGTWIAGVRVDHGPLRFGDRVRLGPEVTFRLVRLNSTLKRSGPALSVRQLELARMVAAGLSNTEIAHRLGISRRTVTSHLDHIYTRLNLRTRTALAVWLLEREPSVFAQVNHPVPVASDSER